MTGRFPGLRQAGHMLWVGSLLLLATPSLLGGEAEDPGNLVRVLTGLEPESVTVPLRVLAIVTVFSVVPSVVLLATCFPRILIVLSFLRRALGTQDLPSNQIIAGLTLILTVLIMLPVWKKIHAEALVPLQSGELEETQLALEKASSTLKQFMLSHTFQKDLRLFVELSEAGAGEGSEDGDSGGGVGATTGTSPGSSPAEERTVETLGFFVVLPAFVLSELKTAFQMGFLIYLPFLVIDLVVSAVLISMGMFMLPPVLVSLPLKVLVFVLADGWNLVVSQVIQSFQVMA